MNYTYFNKDDIILIHANMIKRYGGIRGLKDISGINYIVDAPKMTYDSKELYPSLYDKAAAYMYHIARGHPFCDGNKRTATYVCFLFLMNHGKTIDPVDFLEELVLKVAQGQCSIEECSHILKGLLDE